MLTTYYIWFSYCRSHQITLFSFKVILLSLAHKYWFSSSSVWKTFQNLNGDTCSLSFTLKYCNKVVWSLILSSFFSPVFSEVVLRKKNYQMANFHTNLNYSSAEKYKMFHCELWRNISNTHPFQSALSYTKKTRKISSSHG